MRLNCGPTWQEKWEAKKQRLSQKHTWFAWRPVRIGDRCVWLETVLRTGKYHYGTYTSGPRWEWSYETID